MRPDLPGQLEYAQGSVHGLWALEARSVVYPSIGGQGTA